MSGYSFRELKLAVMIPICNNHIHHCRAKTPSCAVVMYSPGCVPIRSQQAFLLFHPRHLPQTPNHSLQPLNLVSRPQLTSYTFPILSPTPNNPSNPTFDIRPPLLSLPIPTHFALWPLFEFLHLRPQLSHYLLQRRQVRCSELRVCRKWCGIFS